MKLIFYLLLLTFAICLGSTNGYAQNGGNPNPSSIIITITDPFGQIPRTPTNIPIVGYVLNNTINLFFNDDLGQVLIVLEEAIDGVLLSTAVDTSEGFVCIPFSGAPGSYTLTFTLEDGTSYIGRFDIL